MSQSATRDRGRIDGRSPGRPRDAAIDEQVLRATLDLLVERGLESTTIQAVSDRTGIARATIYLRWPGRTALILAALRWAIDRPPMLLTADLATDMRRGAERARQVLLQETFVAALPTLMQVFLDGEGPAAGLTFDSLYPERAIDGQLTRPERRPFPAADILRCVAHEALVTAVAAATLAAGKPLHPDDHDRLMLAAGRLQEAVRIGGGYA